MDHIDINLLDSLIEEKKKPILEEVKNMLEDDFSDYDNDKGSEYEDKLAYLRDILYRLPVGLTPVEILQRQFMYVRIQGLYFQKFEILSQYQENQEDFETDDKYVDE